MRQWMLVLCLCPMLCVGVRADVYRCQGAFGEPAFSQRPCAGGTVVELGTRAGGPGSATGLRPAERAWLKSREVRRKRTRRSAGVRGGSAADERAAVQRQAYRCRHKRRALEAVRAKLRHGYKPASGERLRRSRRAHEDYLSTFCS